MIVYQFRIHFQVVKKIRLYGTHLYEFSIGLWEKNHVGAENGLAGQFQRLFVSFGLLDVFWLERVGLFQFKNVSSLHRVYKYIDTIAGYGVNVSSYIAKNGGATFLRIGRVSQSKKVDI